MRTPCRTLMYCAAVSLALASDDGRAASIVEVAPQDLSAVRAEPVRASAHATLTGAGSPLERSRELYRSSDGRLAVAVSWTDPLKLRLSSANVDEVVFLQEGEVEIVDVADRSRTFRAGEAFILPRGFSGEWRQRVPVRKVVVSYAAPAATGSAAAASPAAVVAIERRVLDGTDWTPVQEAPFARLTSGNQPKYRAAVTFTSSDGRLVVDVSSYEVMSLETSAWPIDEFMYFLEGEVEIRDAAGHGGVYGPGDAITTPKGWTGTWRQASPITKIAVSYDSSERAK